MRSKAVQVINMPGEEQLHGSFYKMCFLVNCFQGWMRHFSEKVEAAQNAEEAASVYHLAAVVVLAAEKAKKAEAVPEIVAAKVVAPAEFRSSLREEVPFENIQYELLSEISA